MNAIVPRGTGDIASFCVSAEHGATIEGPEGLQLTIPPGALERDTAISVELLVRDETGRRLYALEPAGTVFSIPTTVRLPLPEDGYPLTVHHVSRTNEPIDVGSELSVTVPITDGEVDWDARAVSFPLAHFSLIDVYPVHEYAYLVYDLPEASLSPGDILVTLTQQFDGYGPRNWTPGHVGMVSDVPLPGADIAHQIEATPSRVRSATVQVFESTDGHLPLGARVPRGDIVDSERMAMVAFLRSSVGMPYSILADIEENEGEFSCVSLVELALERGGHGVLPWYQEIAYATPHDIFSETEPVRTVEVRAGELIEVPMYGVIAEVTNVFMTGYEVDPSRTMISMGDAPEGATLAPRSLVGIGSAGAMGMVFSWTPPPSAIGAGFEVPLTMTFEQQLSPIDFIPARVDETLLVRVQGAFDSHEIRARTDAAAIASYTVWFDTIGVPDEDIRGIHIIDEATREPPSSMPFPFHELTFEMLGRDDAGRLGVRWTLEWTVPPDERPDVLDAPPIQVRIMVDFDRPRWRGEPGT